MGEGDLQMQVERFQLQENGLKDASWVFFQECLKCYYKMMLWFQSRRSDSNLLGKQEFPNFSPSTK